MTWTAPVTCSGVLQWSNGGAETGHKNREAQASQTNSAKTAQLNTLRKRLD